MYEILMQYLLIFNLCVIAVYDCYLVCSGIKALIKWIRQKLRKESAR